MMLVSLTFFSFGRTEASQRDTLRRMEVLLPLLDSTHSPDGWQKLSEEFLSYTESMPGSWLPHYYASLCHVMKGYVISEDRKAKTADRIDAEADAAEAHLQRAEALDTVNSETLCLRKMIASLRITAQPMARFGKYQPTAEKALKSAEAMDPDNPRVLLLAAQDRYFIPPMLGGNRQKAREMLREALVKFADHRPKSPLHPSWGATQARELLSRTD
jgi:hypothetical protein